MVHHFIEKLLYRKDRAFFIFKYLIYIIKIYRFFNLKMLYRKVLFREKEFSEFSENSPELPAPLGIFSNRCRYTD